MRQALDPHGFDWLLQHELAHEWFGNLMTHRRAADAWLHEGTGAYMQPAYSKELMGDASYTHRLYEAYLKLKNCMPIVTDDDADIDTGFHDDIYAKSSLVLHTLRTYIGDEPFWRSLRRLIYDTADPWALKYPIEPRYRTTGDFVSIVSEEAGRDLSWFFNTYLFLAELPELNMNRDDSGITLTWRTPGADVFVLPVPVSLNGSIQRVDMGEGSGYIPADRGDKVLIDPHMNVLRDLPIIGDCEQQSDR